MFYLLKRKIFRQKVFILQRKIFSLKKYYPIFDMPLLNANATINRPAVFPTGNHSKSKPSDFIDRKRSADEMSSELLSEKAER